MPYTPSTVIEKVGAASAVGIAKELVYATPVAPTTFEPITGCTLEAEPGVFSPSVMSFTRDEWIYVLVGEQKNSGAIEGPLFPVNGIPLLMGAIGYDGGGATIPGGTATPLGAGITGTAAATITTAVASTSSQNLAVGVTSITVASGTGFLAGQVLVLEPGTANAETLILTSIATNVLTVPATAKAHNGTVTPFTVAVAGWKSNGTVAANATSITLAAGGGAYFSAVDLIQIDINSGTSSSSEVHAIQSIATDTITLKTGETMTFAHATAVQVFKVVSPYTHTFLQSNLLPSFTVEKNIGGFQSQRFAGCRVNKYALKVPTGNNPSSFNADVIGSVTSLMGTPSAVTQDAAIPFTFAEATLTTAFSGNGDLVTTQASNISLDIDNGVKPTYTFNGAGNHGPTFVTPTKRMVQGTFSAIFQSLNDPDWGFFQQMLNNQQTKMTFTLSHPGSLSAGLGGGQSITITLPQVNITKDQIQPKFGDVITESLSFNASYQISSATTIKATVANSIYLPY